MMDEEKLKEYRITVMEDHAVMEKIISAIITYHYFKKYVNIDFEINVLNDVSVTTATKIRILKGILKLKRKKIAFIKKVKRINTIRNHFVHCFKKVNIDGKLIMFFPYFEKKKRIFDFEKEYKEFRKKYDECITELLPIYYELSGELPEGFTAEQFQELFKNRSNK